MKSSITLERYAQLSTCTLKEDKRIKGKFSSFVVQSLTTEIINFILTVLTTQVKTRMEANQLKSHGFYGA
jgi:hypothetical protein